MPTVSRSVEPISPEIRRSTAPVRQTSDRDMVLRSYTRRISFHDKPWTRSELKISSHPEILEIHKLDISRGGADGGLVINGLERLINSKSHFIIKLNTRRLLEAHNKYLAALLERESEGRRSIHATEVFGIPLYESSKYAFTSALFNGHDLRLPIVVFNCIEELYRTGIYQPALFRTPPCHKRLSELVRIFNSSEPHRNYQSSNRNRRTRVAQYNATLLYLESTQDICALLTDYLYSLPEPIIPPYLLGAIWEAGGLNQDGDEHSDLGAVLPIEETQRRKSAPSLVRTFTDECETTRITIMQHLLCLLPSSNFSLLVYLLAFFSHVTMMQDINGASTPELGRLFGKCIFGEREAYQTSDAQNRTYNVKDGKVMLCWFLRRWGSLSNGLFDVMKNYSTCQSPMTYTAEGNLTSPTYTNTAPVPDLQRKVQKRDERPSPDSTQLHLQDVFSPHDVDFTKSRCQSNGTEGAMDILVGQILSRELNTVTETRNNVIRESEEAKESRLSATSTSMSRVTSVYSAPDSERLLDVAFPTLFDNFHFLDNISSEALDAVKSTGANQPTTADECQEDSQIEFDNKLLLQAQAKIRDLEHQLVKSDAMVGQAMEVMFGAKRRIEEIDDRLEELAIVLRSRCNVTCQLPLDGFGPDRNGKIWRDHFEVVLLERRQVYEEVVALRELISAEL